MACPVKLRSAAAAAARTDLVALFGIARRFGPKNWIFVADDAARKLFSHKSRPEARPGGRKEGRVMYARERESNGGRTERTEGWIWIANCPSKIELHVFCDILCHSTLSLFRELSLSLSPILFIGMKSQEFVHKQTFSIFPLVHPSVPNL